MHKISVDKSSGPLTIGLKMPIAFVLDPIVVVGTRLWSVTVAAFSDGQGGPSKWPVSAFMTPAGTP
jgi:hypothetical protein